MRPLRSLAPGALALAAGAALAATEAPPRERDCARWADATSTRPRLAEPEPPASGVPSSVYADRMPNAELAPGGRRLVSLELLHCEQLNLKDKLNYLIRSLQR
jgi:hypothetical protein